MELVKILNGTYRGEAVVNQSFEVLSPLKHGAKGSFITVRPNDSIGVGRDKIRINALAKNVKYSNQKSKIQIPVETDNEIIARIGERFEILDQMTRATVTGQVRAMILTGPPGIGKSFGVIKELERANLFQTVKSMQPKFEVLKGSTSAIGLYTTLYNNSGKDNVLVFDDCDTVLYDEISLNLLKAALDTSKTRKISWHSASTYLEKEEIPDTFNFEGSVIFITNVNFDNIKSKKLQDHLAALQSRCHYVDLTINSARDKYLRIQQIYQTGALFDGYNISQAHATDIMSWIDENKDNVRELSLRLAIKAVELVKISPNNWRRMAQATLIKE